MNNNKEKQLEMFDNVESAVYRFHVIWHDRFFNAQMF